MSTNTQKTTILTILFLLTIIVTNTVFAEELIDVNKQILEASNNGLIQGLCFVYDLITGAFGKLVMCFFVVGLGWGFLIGEVKDHKTIFTFILAIAITFGGVQFAHFISGNDYSCATFQEKAYLDENTIYNNGICPITSIEEYMPAQVWRVCNTTTEKECTQITSYAIEVDNNTSILDKSNNYITLYDCPEGYLKKDRNNYIFYKCNDNGFFTVVSETDIMENGKCLPACSISNLKATLSKYNFDSTDIEIVQDSGYIDENYYSADTKINVKCRSDLYTEYDGNNIKGDGAFVTCSNGSFVANGSCKPQCNIIRTKYNSSTNSWKKCNDVNCSSVESTTEKNFYFGEIVEVDTCKDGYYLNNKTNKLRLQCGDNASWKVLQDGQQCSKTCNIDDIENYTNAKIGLCLIEGNACTSEIGSEKILFFPDESVGIYDCKTNFEMSYTKTNLPAIFTCKTDGKWENSNDGSLCEAKCNINQIPSSAQTTSWKYFDYSVNNYIELPTNTTTVKSGYKIKTNTCISGYAVNPNAQSTFVCKNGEFILGGISESNVCRPTCNFSALIQMEQVNNAKVLILSSFGGKYLDDNKDGIYDEIIEISSITDSSYSKINSFYTIQGCKDGYSIDDGKIPVIFKCTNDAVWNVSNRKENVCKKNCQKTSLPTNDKVLAWGVKNSSTSGNLVEFITESISSDSKVRPKTCVGGYNIDNFNTSYYICNDGEFVKENLSETFTVDNICSKEASFDCKKEDLPVNNKVSTWEYKNIDTNNSFVEFNVDTIKSGSEVRPKACATGYKFDNSNESYYLCNNGTFVERSLNDLLTVNNICTQNISKSCKKTDLINMSENKDKIYSWKFKKANMENTWSSFGGDSVISGSKVQPNSCVDGYDFDENNESYYLCNNGEFTTKNQSDVKTTANICITASDCDPNNLPNKDKVSIWEQISNAGGEYSQFSLDETVVGDDIDEAKPIKSGVKVGVISCKEAYIKDSDNTSYYVCSNGIFIEKIQNNYKTADNICNIRPSCKTSDLPNKDKVSIWKIVNGGKFSTDNTKTEYKEFVYSDSVIEIDQCVDGYTTHSTNKYSITYVCNNDGNFTVQGDSQMTIDNICTQ